MEDIILNRLSKFIDEIRSLSDQALNLCDSLSNNNLETAKVVKTKLKSILSLFTSELYNYFKICNNPDPDEISDFTTHQLKGEEVLAELDERIKMRIEKPTTLYKESETPTYSKLPDLNLPEFSGNLLEWHQFWDQFTSNINRRKLNDVDKLLYLKSSLKGDAARLVDGFDTTNRSYQIAVDTLRARYGRDREIIYAHHDALGKVKRAERMEDCRSTLDEVERHLRVLQSLKEDVNSNQMQFLIMGKFPTEIIYEVKMRLCKEEANSVEEILKQLSTIISAKEEARRITQEKTTEHEAPQYTVKTLYARDATRNDKGGSSSTKISKDSKVQRKQWNENKTRSNNWNSRQSNRPNKRKFEHKKEDNKNFNKAKRKRFLFGSCIFCGEHHNNVDCKRIKTIKERKWKLKGRCFNCLKWGHMVRDCSIKKKCEYCNKKHHEALCYDKLQNKDKQEKQPTSVMHTNGTCPTILQTAVVSVQGPGQIVKACRILLDCGSQRSYVTASMAKELSLQAEEQNSLTIFTFGSQKPKELESPLVKLNLLTQNRTIRTIFANVVPSITHGVPYPKRELLDYNTKIKVQLADDGSLSDRVDILLGNDYYYTIMSTRKIHLTENLYLVESEFGWILSGRTFYKPVEQLSALTYFQSSCEDKLTRPDLPINEGNLKILWDLESIGITDSPKLNRDEEAIKHFNETTEYRENRYYVSWPWNDYPINLPSNFGSAFGRLVNLLKRLDKDTLKLYDETLMEQLEKGVIEEVPKGVEVDHPIHYIPHHGVSAPGKSLRIVYDASAKTKDNKSLNECLYCGPMLLEDLTGLIIKFRSHTIGLTADVEKAFLQIGLKEQDRDVTRFLWIKNIYESVNEDNLVHLRFTRVPFGIISSPFILNATVKHHLTNAETENVRKLANEIYVDNVVTGTNTLEEALDLYQDSKDTFKQISMNLREWSSNSMEFMQQVPDNCPDKVVKILGLDWYLEDDTLHLRKNTINYPNTKRGILKTVASIYDPCGYTVPSLLSAKLLLQDLWKMKIKWDTPLSEEIINRWNDIQQDLEEVNDVRLARCYMKYSQNNEYQIHCFTDSSTKAYAAVVYVVGKNEKSFVIGKSRLVPIKDQEHLKIPRLELLGVLIGSRLIQYTLKFINLNITKQILWTDSQIVIDWLNSNKLLTPFVSRRIDEIKRNKDLIVRYVPSELNPADVATRPSNSKEEKDKWLLGPQFLLGEPNLWPSSAPTSNSFLAREDLSNKMEIETEMKANQERTDKETEIVNVDKENKIIDDKIQEIQNLQNKHFPDEIKGIETSLKRNLGLFIDVDGLLRCKGRLKNTNWSYDKRYPILIPKDSEFTNKMIMKTHQENYHVGANHTLSIIRQSYWIPQGKRQVQKILGKCPRCLKHSGGPFKLPPTPALPHERVNFSKPFTFTGIDYMGPVLVKTDKGTAKRWICLFTCLAIRAVHLEIVQDLSAEEGLLALRRMISTRGIPTLITSDNALHFKLIADIVSNAYCVENKIKWRFIPELAPWFGGFYERLVGLVKHCMRRTLHKHLLRDNQLSTIVKEIEAVVNTRPLTCVDSELEHILKPADFLQIGACITLETAHENVVLKGTSTKTNLIQGWKKARIILEEFKELFCNRYLPSLRERYSHSHKQPRVTSNLIPKEGQIVQIKGDKNREGWKVGKIISLVKGKDDMVRVAKVKVGDTIFTRSIAHLYPLEVEDDKPQEPIIQYTSENFETQKLPDEVCQESITIPDVEIAEPDEALKQNTCETENTENMDITDDMADVTVKEIGTTNESDETVEIDLRDNTVDADHMAHNKEMLEERSEKVNSKRMAAVRALERIREWTRNLMNTLL